MPTKSRSIRAGIIAVQIILIGLLSFTLLQNRWRVQAAGTITVNSQADTVSNDGECTLREAIIAANTDTASGAAVGECAAGSGVDTIEFAISGTASFTNAGQDGYTIEPTTAYPTITERVVINGYSQVGSQQNTAIAPNPINARLLIEIDGNSVANDNGAFVFGQGSDNSAVRGLVINNFAEGVAIASQDNVGLQVQGNYIGVNPQGTAAKSNEIGLDGATASFPNAGEDVLVGGLEAEDRNILSGNSSGTTAAGGYPASGWVVQGNYIGVAADGVTAVPNANIGGSGALSIDNCEDVIIGGTQAGAANVISGNNNYGLAPDNINTARTHMGLTVQGNYIGTDYTGEIAVPNTVGIIMGPNTGDSLIGGDSLAARNIISGNTLTGIVLGSPGITIAGNIIGLDVDGMEPVSNGLGILVGAQATIGVVDGRNIISANTKGNILAASITGINPDPVDGLKVQGNYIGTDSSGQLQSDITAAQGFGISMVADVRNSLIGGDLPNTIAGNRGYGVGVANFTFTPLDATLIPQRNSILQNKIFDTVPNPSVSGSQGLAIDLYAEDNDDIDWLFNPALHNNYTDLGANTNVPAGIVANKANDYINHPVINSFVATGNHINANVDVVADGADAGSYRVEFFANETNSTEAKNYLGSVDVNAGEDQDTSFQLSQPIDLAGMYVTATTTQIEGGASVSGFGATSELSEPLAASVILVASELPKVGALPGLMSLALGLVVALSVGIHQRRLKSRY